MEFQELKFLIKKLFNNYVKKHIKRILIALVLSILVAGSTSGIAWLLDPAVKKIFIDQDQLFAWTIPLLIILAFSSKGLSLYFARINIIKVGEEISGSIKKKIAEIDISIHHEFLNKSFGSSLLKNGIRNFSKEKKIKIFKSHVLKTNKGSQKIFIKNKFLIYRKSQNLMEYIKIIK